MRSLVEFKRNVKTCQRAEQDHKVFIESCPDPEPEPQEHEHVSWRWVGLVLVYNNNYFYCYYCYFKYYNYFFYFYCYFNYDPLWQVGSSKNSSLELLREAAGACSTKTSTLGQQLCIFDNQLRSAPVQEHSYMNMHKKYFFVIWPNTPGQAGALLWSSEAAGWSSRANWSVIRSQAILHHILMRGSKAQRKAHPDQRLIFNQHEKWKEKETKKGLACTWWLSDRLTILLANAKSF